MGLRNNLNLYPFQQAGVNYLVTRRTILLADEMGLGKTVQSATAIRKLFEQGAISKVLVICPSSLCLNWKSELKKWSELAAVIYHGAERYGMLYGNAKILISSYETICRDLESLTLRGERYFDANIDLLIVDEAQRLKYPEGIRAKILAKIIAPRRWAISGTPLENHPRELASILRFLEPNEYLSEFSLDDIDETVALSARLILRRTKSEVGIELPRKTLTYLRVPLGPEQASDYAQARDKLLEITRNSADPSKTREILLKGIQELRKIAVISNGNVSSKIDLIESDLEEIFEKNEKVVIFSSFSNLVLPELVARLNRFGALLYTGSMTTQEREITHNKFLNDPNTRVMCASLRAAGVGLTWTVANHVYHLDTWWNPQALNQADDRVHRIGQDRPVFVKRLIAANTIEEAIEDLLATKVEIFNLIFAEKAPGVLDDQAVKDIFSLI
jgi:SNF2 family DNA or RNA helicase